MVGNILQGLLSKEGSPSKKDFAQMLGVSLKTLYNVIDGSSQLTLPQTVKAGEILNFDIISEYKARTGLSDEGRVNEPSAVYGRNKSNLLKLMFSLNLAATVSTYENFPELLKRTKATAEELGFTII